MATRRSAVRRLQQAEPSAGTTYDAFISYSRDSDAVLAVALARGLTRLTRPWYRTRALRVFRDDASLAASPALWPSIEAALRDARFLVLLASSASARSPWVAREVEWWIAQRGLQRLLIVLTDAEPGAAGGGFEDMLPPVLRDALVDEPRFVDLRSARGRADLSLEDADFRAAVADLAAPMHGVPKEELIGEDVRQHRRTMRVVRGTAAVLGVLAIGAGAAAWLAVEQRNTARDQARRAIARSLALESAANLGRATDISLLLALEAYRMEPSFPARDALLTAIEHAAPRTAVFPRPRSGAIQRLDLSHDGRTALVSPYVGRPQLLDARRAETRELPWSVNHAQATNGRTVVSVHRSDRAQLWDLVRGLRDGPLDTVGGHLAGPLARPQPRRAAARRGSVERPYPIL